MPNDQMRFRLGGGIASGKSAAAARFERFGATTLSADEVGRAVLEPGTRQTSAVLERWPGVQDEAGHIDRGRLGRLVFADDASLAELEAMTHPEIGRRLRSQSDALPADSVVILEIPVLHDVVGEQWPWIVVDAPDEMRVARAVEGRGMTVADLSTVMARQPDRNEWLAAASWVIDNSGDQDQLTDQCRRVWERIRRTRRSPSA